MNINDKIKQILIERNFTPSYFADEIGVQRSSISHILSGRNRPSFDIIQKIIRRFPELGYEWIMEEDNQSAPNQTQSPSTSRYLNPQPVLASSADNRFESRQNNSGPVYSSPPRVASSGPIRSQRHEIAAAPPDISSTDPVADSTDSTVGTAVKKVERILIFYSDGSFREYMPA
ncbi:transcriptional regulator with XRE-family HTH domain [Spirosoma lacussanchae]|uniref:helix-turn-helix transcriptional regulator n=1 Tax=Spirosoma lacussanchae TaxID=1884249 RepID=UPI001107C8BC|nr:helix-turn-helix transcriptional regulator [Spirosoma lacussanchae]